MNEKSAENVNFDAYLTYTSSSASGRELEKFENYMWVVCGLHVWLRLQSSSIDHVPIVLSSVPSQFWFQTFTAEHNFAEVSDYILAIFLCSIPDWILFKKNMSLYIKYWSWKYSISWKLYGLCLPNNTIEHFFRVPQENRKLFVSVEQMFLKIIINWSEIWNMDWFHVIF